MSAQRLFFAIWPDDPVRARLRAAAHELVPPDARAVAPDAVHLTLLFIGSADTARRACLEQAADGIECPGFTLTFDQAGFWRKPQILWLGCSAQPAPLLALVQGLTAGAAQCGIEPGTRPYQAHVTLARIFTPVGVAADRADRLAGGAVLFGGVTYRSGWRAV